MSKPQLVSCNGGESYAAIVDTPFGEVSVHADEEGINIFLIDEKVLPLIRVIDPQGFDHKVVT